MSLLATLFLSAAPLLLAAETAPASPPAPGANDDAQLAALADDYFDHFYFPENPSLATGAGIHTFDDRLEDYSRADVERQIKGLHAYEKKFARIDPASLSEFSAGDRELLLSNIRSTLLSLERIRFWARNPDIYSSGITSSAYSLMQRKFAPPNDRLRSLIAREEQMPAVFDAARKNLHRVPKIWTEIAIQQIPGIISFFASDLPQGFLEADDADLKAQFARSNAAVIAALKSYASWLQTDLLPRSNGDFRFGEKIYREKLRDDEMVDVPLHQLLAIAYADMHRNQAEFARVAKELEPEKTAKEVLALLMADHPASDQLLSSFAATFDGLIKFIGDRQLINIPSTVRPILRETPPFMRATTFASMDTPGPFEPTAQEAYFNVTLPDPSWDPARRESYLGGFNFPTISNTAVHEAYPGHYVQFLWMHQLHDRVRELLGASSNVEGWAHYCEQLLIDEGFAEPGIVARDARESKLMRLGQLQDALLRDARFVVGIEMHTGKMTLAQAIDFFADQGYASRPAAEMETKRGTADATYLYYTLGKLQILKLREDLKAKEGSHFSLASFHDRLMQQGYAPIKIVRKALLHDDSPTL